MTRRSAPEGAPHKVAGLATDTVSVPRGRPPFRYPGQRKALWLRLSELRTRERHVSDHDASETWYAFVGDRSPEAALGELVDLLQDLGHFKPPRGAA